MVSTCLDISSGAVCAEEIGASSGVTQYSGISDAKRAEWRYLFTVGRFERGESEANARHGKSDLGGERITEAPGAK